MLVGAFAYTRTVGCDESLVMLSNEVHCGSSKQNPEDSRTEHKRDLSCIQIDCALPVCAFLTPPYMPLYSAACSGLSGLGVGDGVALAGRPTQQPGMLVESNLSS